MKVSIPAFIIVSKQSPIEVVMKSGEPVDEIDLDCIYTSHKEAETELSHFDWPDNYNILEGEISFNI